MQAASSTPKSTKPRVASKPAKGKATQRMVSNIQRAKLEDRQVEQVLMSAQQIDDYCTFAAPKVYQGTTVRYLNGPKGEHVFLDLPTVLRLAFTIKNDGKFDKGTYRAGFAEDDCPDAWAAFARLDEKARTFIGDDRDGAFGLYMPLTLGTFITLDRIPAEWMINVAGKNEKDDSKDTDVNFDIHVKGLHTKLQKHYKKDANGNRLEFELDANGKAPDSAFETTLETRWALSVEPFHGQSETFFDDRGDNASEISLP